MILEISDVMSIADLKEAFSRKFPYLGLEFYTRSHEMQEPTGDDTRISPDTVLADIRLQHNPGMLEIKESDKTGMIEQELRRRFGLNAQVMRFHGDRWIQTAGTDELTLEELNEIASRTARNL